MTDCTVRCLDGLDWRRYHTKKALWDTGASTTAITKEVADRLGAEVVGWGDVGSIGGNSRAGIARVSLDLDGIALHFIEVKIIDLTEREREAKRLGIPYTHPDVWIGMDVISLGRLEVDSTSGETVLRFTMPTL